MAKKPKPEPAGPTKRVRSSAPIQVSADLAHMAAVVATHDRITVGELLNDHLRPFVEQQYRRVQAEIVERVKRMDAGGG